LDKKELAALLESLCERPFVGDQEGRPLDVEAIARRAAHALSHAEEEQFGSMAGQAESPQAGDPGRDTAALASILSGTATEAQCQAFQEAALTSDAVRLEAQSALAFVDGIERAPLRAPAHLVEHVRTSPGGAPSRAKPGIRSRLSGGGKRRGQAVAACAVMLMAGALSWSLLWRPADLTPDGAAVPVATNPKEAPPISGIDAKPDPTPAASIPTPTPAPVPVPAPPPPVLAPAPVSAPAQALADPCDQRRFATSEAGARSAAGPKVAKPVPNGQPKPAAVAAIDPGCINAGTTEAGRNPQADQGPLRPERPAKIGRSDRAPAAAAASAPARPPSPAVRPGPIEQRR
jgi:hypothetical protein